MQVLFRQVVWQSLLGVISLVVGVALIGSIGVQGLWAAPSAQIIALREPALTGSLPNQYNAHVLGLESTTRDGIMKVTLAYDPQNNPLVRGYVNFLVLTEDGLRRFQAGEDPDTLSIATGSPVPFDRVGNKMAVTLQDSGRGKYTLIVYNNSAVPVTYYLTVEGGVLLDNANQAKPWLPILLVDSGEQGPTPLQKAEDTAEPAKLMAGSVTERRFTGALVRHADRHYLSVKPDEIDGSLVFYMQYDPLDQPDLVGKVNFWVLDDDGMRRVISGVRPDDINLGTGFPIPYQPSPNKLQANFNASGKNPYTVMLFNNGEIPITYTFAVNGGMLIDQYGQTNEAKAAAANPQPTVAATPTPAPVMVGVPQLSGKFTQSYQHHYYGLTANLRDGLVVVTLDFSPRDNQTLRDNLNFMILDEDGMRRVVNGGRPEDYDLAAGSLVNDGDDKGKLRAVFNASAHGQYTVIVYNNSDIPAEYLLSTEAGLLSTEAVSESLP